MKKVIAIYLTLFGLVVACYAEQATQLVLRGEDANIEGTILRHWPDTNHLGNWLRPEDIIRFKIPGLEQGKYKVSTRYGCPDEFGGKVSIKLNNQEFKRTFGSTGSWQATIIKPVGYFEHSGGAVDIALTILRQNGENQAVIDLHALTFEKM